MYVCLFCCVYSCRRSFCRMCSSFCLLDILFWRIDFAPRDQTQQNNINLLNFINRKCSIRTIRTRCRGSATSWTWKATTIKIKDSKQAIQQKRLHIKHIKINSTSRQEVQEGVEEGRDQAEAQVAQSLQQAGGCFELCLLWLFVYFCCSNDCRVQCCSLFLLLKAFVFKKQSW